jgi:hypothetical protein
VPGDLTRQLNLERDQIQSSTHYSFQHQVQEQLNLALAVNANGTPLLDCDGTPDRDQDRLQDRTQDRIHQTQVDGMQNAFGGENRNGPGSSPGNRP